MLLVVADTSPIRYLVQIGQIELLRLLFGRIMLPVVVADELRHPSAPPMVQTWVEQLPGWAEILQVAEIDDPELRALDPGERSAIALALSLKADLILIDERRGARAALQKGLEVTGTLGILDLAAQKGLVSLKDAFVQLKGTNFRYRQSMMDALLGEDPDR